MLSRFNINTNKYSRTTLLKKNYQNRQDDLRPLPYTMGLHFADGSGGYIHYRSGELNLHANNGHSVENTDDFGDYALTLEQVTSWLESLFYDVEKH